MSAGRMEGEGERRKEAEQRHVYRCRKLSSISVRYVIRPRLPNTHGSWWSFTRSPRVTTPPASRTPLVTAVSDQNPTIFNDRVHVCIVPWLSGFLLPVDSLWQTFRVLRSADEPVTNPTMILIRAIGFWLHSFFSSTSSCFFKSGWTWGWIMGLIDFVILVRYGSIGWRNCRGMFVGLYDRVDLIVYVYHYKNNHYS